MKRLMMAILLGCLTGYVRAANVTILSSETWTAADYAAKGLTASDTITISSGATLTFSLAQSDALTVPCTIAGAGGVTVAGTLGKITFSGNNTFTGAFTTAGTTQGSNKNVSNWITVTSATGLGKGTVRVTDGARVILAVTGVANAFEVSHAYGMLVFNSADMDFNGTITWTGAANGTLRFAAAQKVNLRGAVNAGTAGIRKTDDAAQAEIHVYGKMTAAYVGADSGSAFFRWNTDPSSTGDIYNHGRGTWYFHSPGDGVRHEVGYPSASGLAPLVIEDADCFVGTAILSLGYTNTWAEGDNPVATLKADQTFDSLYENTASFLKDDKPLRLRVTSSTKATLTLKGSSDSTSYAVLDGNVSLNWDSDDKHTLTLSKRAHTTTGALKVTSGTVKADATTTFSALGALDVGADGVFECVSGGVPFAEAQVAATIAAGGQIKVPEGTTLSLKSLSYDGWPVDATTYTSAPWLTGGGSVMVASGVEVVWTKADYDAYAATHDSIEIGTGSTLVFNYAAGEESTVDLSISGGGAVKFAGTGGKITMAGDNTFAGGATYAGATCVAVTSATGLGTGTITVSSTAAGVSQSDSGVLHGLWFVGDYTLGNPIVVTKENYLSFNASSSTTSIKVNSPITANPVTATVHLRVGVGTAEFFGEMTGGTFRKSGNNYSGTIVFKNVANIDNFYCTSGDWGRGTVRFAGTMNAGTICNSIAGIETGAENPWSDETMLTFYPPGASYYQDDDKNYRLGHDAVCDRIGLNGGSLYFGKTIYDGRFKKNTTTEYMSPSVYSDSGKTLTMKGRGDGWTYATLKGSVNLVWDPIGEYTYTFSNRLHTTTGSIEVRRGTLVAGIGCEFSGVTRVVVRSGATLRLDSKLGDLYTRVFTANGLKTLEVEKGAKVEIAQGIAETFGRVIYDGAQLADDTYSSELWLSGGGTVTISSSQTVDFWKAAKSGLWGEAANWNLGAVPTSEQDVDVTVPGPSYTSTVAATPAAIKSLVIGNSRPGETATVSFQTAYAPASGGLKATVEAGGVLDVSGASGSLVLAGQKAGDLVVKKDGRISLSGSGVFRVQNGSWDQVHISGDGSLTATDNAVFSIGTPDAASSSARVGNLDMAFSGNAAFHGPDAKVGAGIFAASQSGVNQTNVWAFVDSATYGPRPAYFHNLGAEKDCVQILRLASEATHVLSDSMRVGEGFGTGILRIEKGEVRAGVYGIFIGSEYQRQSVTCVSRGILEMTGGTLDMSAASKDTVPRGLIVGSGWNVGYTGGVMKGGDFRGWIEMDGGNIVDSGDYSRFAVGVGFAEGVINQCGGSISKATTDRAYATIIGWGGATGAWNLSGGSADIKGYLYVGGATTNELGVCLKASSTDAICVIGERTNCSVGTLDVAGGTFAVGKDLILSGDGQGTLKLKPGAKLTVGGNLDARAGSKLVIDCCGYVGGAKTLATFGGTTTAFEDVTLLQDGDAYVLDVQPTRVRVKLTNPPGAMLIVR